MFQDMVQASPSLHAAMCAGTGGAMVSRYCMRGTVLQRITAAAKGKNRRKENLARKARRKNE